MQEGRELKASLDFIVSIHKDLILRKLTSITIIIILKWFFQRMTIRCSQGSSCTPVLILMRAKTEKILFAFQECLTESMGKWVATSEWVTLLCTSLMWISMLTSWAMMAEPTLPLATSHSWQPRLFSLLSQSEACLAGSLLWKSRALKMASASQVSRAQIWQIRIQKWYLWNTYRSFPNSPCTPLTYIGHSFLSWVMATEKAI